MMKIINAIGTTVHEGQVKYLHVASCECKNKLARAKSENGLRMYVGAEKFKCKECGQVLKYEGQVYFKGNHRLDASEVLQETDFNEDDNSDHEEQNGGDLTMDTVTKEAVNNVNGLIKGIKRKGVTNAQMITTITENALNSDNLKALYSAYPEIFKSSVRYLPINVRIIAGRLVQEFEPEFTFNEGRKVKYKDITNEGKESNG